MGKMTSGGRVLARSDLQQAIAGQGRRLDWLAARIDVSRSFLSRVVAGERTIAASDARVLAALLNSDIAVLFEIPSGTERDPIGTSSRGE